MVALVFVLRESRQIGVMRSIVITKDQCTIRVLVMIDVANLDYGKCLNDQSFFSLEQGIIPTAQTDKEFTGTAGHGKLTSELEFFDFDLLA